MAVAAWLSWMGLAKETTWGTAVAPTTFFRGKSKMLLTDKSPTKEQGFSGIAAQTHAYYAGVHQTDIDTGSLLFYPDDTAVFLMGMLGTDTVSGSGPYMHTLTLNNSAITPSYTWQRYSGVVATADQVAGLRWSELDLKFSNPGTFTAQAKGTGKIVTQATKGTNSYSTAKPLLPWQAAVTFNSSSYLKLIDCSISLKRAVDPIFGMNNSQDQSDQNVDVLGVTGTMTVVPSDLTEFNDYLSNFQDSLSVLFTSGTNTLTLQMTEPALVDGTEYDDTGKYLKGTLKFEAVANATDAGTGNSMFKAIAVNGRTTSY